MATSSSNNGSSGSTMASTIALQIQDRALLLASERGLRDAATVVRNQVKIQLDQQMKEHAVLRNKLLSKLRTRHGYELELHRIKAQQEEHETLIQNEEKEAQVLNEKATSMEEVWKESVQELLAPHQAKRRQYQGYLEQRIRKRQRRSTLQQQKLEFWQNRTQGMRRDQEEMLLERVEVTARTEQTDAQEEEQDEQVSSLALQIKATLTKRSALRLSLQAAKEAYRKVNDEMTKWENACTTNQQTFSASSNTITSGGIVY